MTVESLLARRNHALGQGAPLFYDEPLEIVRGEGAYLFDVSGRRYVDMYNNVPCVGHANPAVVGAMTRQQATLNVHSRYLHKGIVEYAERLATLHGPQIESFVFSCSGTEANEVALQMARAATGKRGVIYSDGTYHGNSEAVGMLSGGRRQSSTHPEIASFPFPDRYRPLVSGLDESALADAYVAQIDKAIHQLQSTGAGVACLIVCSIFANEGLPNVPAQFMARAAARLREVGLDPADYRGRVLDIRNAIATRRRALSNESAPDYARFSDEQLTDAWQYNLFPNVVLSFGVDHLWIMRARPHPTDPGRTEFDKITLTRRPISERATPLPRLGREVFEYDAVIRGEKSMTITIDQDVELLKDVQSGMKSAGFDTVWLSEEEARVKHFHAEWDRRMTDRV